MLSTIGQTNWLAVLLAFVASAVLAGVYFPVLVAKPYAAALGRDAAVKPQGLLRNLGPIVCVLVVTVTSALLLQALHVTTIGGAIGFALVVGIGYLTAMTFQIAINPNFPHPLRYGIVNAPYFIVSSIITAVLVTVLG